MDETESIDANKQGTITLAPVSGSTSPRREVDPLLLQADIPHPKNGMTTTEAHIRRDELEAAKAAITRVHNPKIEDVLLPPDESQPPMTPIHRKVRLRAAPDMMSPKHQPIATSTRRAVPPPVGSIKQASTPVQSIKQSPPSIKQQPASVKQQNTTPMSVKQDNTKVADEEPTPKKIEEVHVVYELCDDGYYRRADRDQQPIPAETPFEEEEEVITDEEMIDSIEADIKSMVLSNKELLKTVLNKKHYANAKAGGPKRFARYRDYIAEVINVNEKCIMISWGIQLFYTAVCFIMETFLEVEMKSYYDSLKQNSIDYARAMMRNPTIKKIGTALPNTRGGSSTAPVSFVSIAVVFGVQILVGCGMAFMLKYSSGMSYVANIGSRTVNGATENYLFRGRPLMEQATVVWDLIGGLMKKQKEYTNTGDVDGDQISVDMEDPE